MSDVSTCCAAVLAEQRRQVAHLAFDRLRVAADAEDDQHRLGSPAADAAADRASSIASGDSGERTTALTIAASGVEVGESADDRCSTPAGSAPA